MSITEARVESRISCRAGTRPRRRVVVLMATNRISTRRAQWGWLPLRETRGTHDLENSGLGPEEAVFSRIIEAVQDSGEESVREASLAEAQSVQGPSRWKGYLISGTSIEGRHGRGNKGVRGSPPHAAKGRAMGISGCWASRQADERSTVWSPREGARGRERAQEGTRGLCRRHNAVEQDSSTAHATHVWVEVWRLTWRCARPGGTL